MIKSRILRATAVALTSVGLVAGLSGIAGASSGSVSNTGPDSSNKIMSLVKNQVAVTNNNHVSLMNQNDQAASSGNTKVWGNTTGGSATSGNATTNNAANVSLSVKNTMPSMSGASTSNTGTINTTGPNSDNKVLFIAKNDVTVSNDNSICIVNTNEQSATTGDATVSHNTTGGSATSGSATTSNSSSFNVSISN